ncbi:MAG: hypothetical protein RJA70_4844 [Pseudomonadota bacterium]
MNLVVIFVVALVEFLGLYSLSGCPPNRGNFTLTSAIKDYCDPSEQCVFLRTQDESFFLAHERTSRSISIISPLNTSKSASISSKLRGGSYW